MANAGAHTTPPASERPGGACALREPPSHLPLVETGVDARPLAAPQVSRRPLRLLQAPPRLAVLSILLVILVMLLVRRQAPYLAGRSPRYVTFRSTRETTALVPSSLGRLVRSAASIHETIGRLRQRERRLSAELLSERAQGDLRGEARVLLDLGQARSSLAGDAASLPLFMQAQASARKLGDRELEARAQIGIGAAHRANGQAEAAIKAYQKAIALWSRSLSLLAAAQIGLGAAYLDLDRPAEAAMALSRAQHLASSISDPGLETAVLIERAHAFAAREDLEKAAFLYAQALRLQPADADPSDQARALAGLADCFAAQARMEEALLLYHQALAIMRELDDRSTTAWILLSIGDARSAIHAPREALLVYREAAALARQAGDLRGQVRSQAGLARAYRQLGDLPAASAAGDQALQLLARAQRRSPVQYDRNTYELLMDVLMERARQPPNSQYDRLAFELSERAHSRALRAALADRSVTEGLQIPLTLDLPAIQHLLDRNTILLEYFLGTERSYLWVVTPATVESFELPARSVVESEVRQAVARWSASYRWTAVDNDPILVRLSTTLLGGVARDLADKRLLVVADGRLRSLPFAALPLPDSSHLPVLARHEVVVAPSASILGLMRQRVAARPPPTKLLAILADPVFTPGDPRLAATGDSRFGSPSAMASRTLALSGENLAGVPRLPESRREAAEISALVPPDQLLTATGFAASRRLATSQRMGEFRILHIATHGFVGSRGDGLPALLLSQLNREGRAQDGLLRGSDIASLDLRTDLVVLSACRTALGSEVKGEGLVGLPEAFLAAGAPRVLSSLWDVDDRATAKLMEQFYRGILEQGLTAAAALRAAQLELRRDPHFSAPRYWSAFTLEGDWQGPVLPFTTRRRTAS